MPTLEVLTLIHAPAERCFRLALSVDLFAISTRQTGETIVAGVRCSGGCGTSIMLRTSVPVR